MNLDPLIRFYENLSPTDIARFPDFYSAEASFKDPFNEVSGIAAIQGIFSHMFRQVREPRFVVTERLADAGGVMLVWDFHFRIAHGRTTQVIHGVSHLKFDADGKVCYHRDYWDAAEELYMKLPGIGLLMRGLRRMLSSVPRD